jgi:hypothetical protein
MDSSKSAHTAKRVLQTQSQRLDLGHASVRSTDKKLSKTG